MVELIIVFVTMIICLILFLLIYYIFSTYYETDLTIHWEYKVIEYRWIDDTLKITGSVGEYAHSINIKNNDFLYVYRLKRAKRRIVKILETYNKN